MARGLSLSSVFELICVVYALTGEEIECILAGKLATGLQDRRLMGFGTGDCKCTSHLFHRNVCPLPEIEKTFSDLGMSCSVVCFS